MKNIKCINNTGKENYLTINNVYEILEQTENGYRLITDRAECDYKFFPCSLFEQTDLPVTPLFPFKVKCKFDYTWVFTPGGGHYQRSLSDYITEDNVYEVTTIQRKGYYILLPDHGMRTEELPEENFKLTNEPVTINPLREQEESEKQKKSNEFYKQLTKDSEQQTIEDSMEQYYNPDNYHARQLEKQRLTSALSKVFTCGIPYTS